MSFCPRTVKLTRGLTVSGVGFFSAVERAEIMPVSVQLNAGDVDSAAPIKTNALVPSGCQIAKRVFVPAFHHTLLISGGGTVK